MTFILVQGNETSLQNSVSDYKKRVFELENDLRHLQEELGAISNKDTVPPAKENQVIGQSKACNSGDFEPHRRSLSSSPSRNLHANNSRRSLSASPVRHRQSSPIRTSEDTLQHRLFRLERKLEDSNELLRLKVSCSLFMSLNPVWI